MIHVSLVKRLALTILQSIFENDPELLVGTLGTKSVVEVLEKRNEIETVAAQAALLYDIGKYDYFELVNLQSRRLEKSERKLIHRHARYGYDTLKELKIHSDICDVALGHHKSFDGKTGYPKEFDNTKSRARIFIDLIKICDCMAAATDEIGRTYKNAKSLDEFVVELSYGAGRVYHPGIVKIIKENASLCDDLEYICTAGRMALYYEAYREFIGLANSTEKKRKKMSRRLKISLAGKIQKVRRRICLKKFKMRIKSRNRCLRQLQNPHYLSQGSVLARIGCRSYIIHKVRL